MLRSGLVGGLTLLAIVGFANGSPAVAAVRHASAARQAVHLADSVMFVTADSGNSARYRVREQLAGFDLPNDAVGSTNGVAGALVIAANGRVLPQSKFVIDVRPLKSDQDRRDNFVRTRLLETATYPSVTLIVKTLGGLKMPLPKSGPVAFDLIGELTVKGVTKPSRWRVDGKVDGGVVSGTASTAFTFEDFQITKPRVPIVLSVADTIKLEYDFRLVLRDSGLR